MEEGSCAGMEEARASGEGVGVSAAGAALPEGIQAPSPLGKATVGTFRLSGPSESCGDVV